MGLIQNNVNQTKTNSLLIQALLNQDAYPRGTDSIRLVETHISWVLLTGQYAYKIKKPVNFGFLDFSTLAKRKFYCQEEVRLNRRLAEAWYVGVVPITGSVEHPNLEGEGNAIEYAVKMLQFPSPNTLSQSAGNGHLSSAEIDQISAVVADFHEAIDKAESDSPYGESDEIKRWFDENFHHIRPLLSDDTQLLQISAVESWGNAEWAATSQFMKHRKNTGFIRECHGDLHLGNMTDINGRIVLFDCIEFNPLLRWIDVISEVAFVVMDLVHLGYESFAYRFLNRYLQQTGDYEGLALLRYYVVYRALVRAKVALLTKSQELTSECADSGYPPFANLAESFIRKKSVMLIITHGFSGSGKSTYASRLAEKIGAIQIRSDIERKRLFGFSALASTGSSTGNGIYSSAAGEMTYSRLMELAKATLSAGFSVIIDAAFLKLAQRNLFRQLAIDCCAKFTIIDFQASVETLRKRIEQRNDDPSEATVDVLNRQLNSAEPLTNDEITDVLLFDSEQNDNLDELVERLLNG